jgi:hypothetical protein
MEGTKQMKSVFLRHHGAFFAGLIDKTESPVSIRRVNLDDNHLYELNSNIGIYITYSSKRLSPWTVTLPAEQVKLIFEKMDQYPHFYLVIVCEFEFSAVINRDQISDLLSPLRENASSITIRTGHERSLAVSGTEGNLRTKLLKSKAYEQLLEIVNAPIK